MKYILYLSVLLLSSINLSSASSIHGYLDYPGGMTKSMHEINITDAKNFSVTMMTKGDSLTEASLWLFDDMGDYYTDDQFWLGNGTGPSIYPGELGAGDEGMYYIVASIFGMQPDSGSLKMNDTWEDFTFPGNEKDSGEYWIKTTGVPAPPVLWLLSAGLLVFVRQRKKFA